MKKLIEKDKLRRYKYKKVEARRLAIKFLQRTPMYLNKHQFSPMYDENACHANAYNVNNKVISNAKGIKSATSKPAALALHSLSGLSLRSVNSQDLNSVKTRIRNRCVISGRARSVYRSFGISRLELRKLALAGSLPFVKKASW